jgi:hypothetical protein
MRVVAEILHAQARLRARRLSYARPRLAECAYERRGQQEYGAVRIIHGIRRRASSGTGAVRLLGDNRPGRHVGGGSVKGAHSSGVVRCAAQCSGK